jgi:hypothetical protein
VSYKVVDKGQGRPAVEVAVKGKNKVCHPHAPHPPVPLKQHEHTHVE